MNRNIGGPIRYDLLAQKHRPVEQTALRDEVRRLAREQQLSARDIAAALRLNLATINEWLAGANDAG